MIALISMIIAALSIIVINTAATMNEIKHNEREKGRLMAQGMDINIAVLTALFFEILEQLGVLHI